MAFKHLTFYSVKVKKIRTQNASKNNFNQKKIQRHLDYIENKIEQYQQEFDKEDLSDELKKQELKEKIKYQNSKKENGEIIV